MLTDSAIRTAKPEATQRKLSDSKGLYLLITPKGQKYWRLKFRFEGKEKLLSLGVYPDVSLKDARDRRDEARKLLAKGVDPSGHRKATKAAKAISAANSFEVIGREWYARFSPTRTASHNETVISRMERDLFPWLGKRPISEIEAPELLTVLRRVEDRGAAETARRLRQIAGQIFRYAISTGRATRDPAADLKGAIPPAIPKHHAAIVDPKGAGALVRAIHGYGGGHIVRCALLLHALTFTRSSELRLAEWSEFDLDAALWIIPAERMKGRLGHKLDHRVPLSRQALEVLRELYPLTGHGKLLFPGQRTHERPISENTINASLRRMGYSKEEMTCHGFRAMARTLLAEQLHIRPDIIEQQLAHAVKTVHGRAYDRTTFWPERIELMQRYADYLDSLREGGKVVPFTGAM